MTRRVSRRAVLAGAGITAASAGCIGRTRNLAGRDRASQLTLQIDTAPADRDPNAIRIARHLAENLNAVGVDARINTLGQTDLWRKVLINRNFDVYVGQSLESDPLDPDSMYALTHSQFAAEAGRQNPFGFTDINGVDELLEAQRRTEDSERSETVADLQRSVCDLQPFSVVAFPDPLTAVREGGFEGWTTDQPMSPPSLLQLERMESGDDGGGTNDSDATNDSDGDEEGDDAAALRLVTTDTHITENWNPLAAEYRRNGTFTSLLYDPLVLADGEEEIPWLCTEWERVDEETIEVVMRDAQWHDGEPVTAEDVAFTYEFLRDTSMDSLEMAVPTPRFRGRSSIVQAATVVDDATVELTVEAVNDAVAARALQVPILPEHVWSDRTEAAEIAGFEFDVETTEAVVSNNEEPVGSGPIRFVEATAEDSVVFERNPHHFLVRSGEDGETTDPRAGIPDRFHGKPAFDRLEVTVLSSDIAAVQAVGDGLADATVSNLGPDAVPRIGREADARLVTGRPSGFYHIGYNTRRAPLSNPRFRGVLASLLDKEALVDDAFDGYAKPAASPLAASPAWVPDDLAWEEGEPDPVHAFIGDDGSLDPEEARDRLRENGYRFNDSGQLLLREE
ncbi:ABC transporter substrate-binding protein [Halorubrum sp. AD140]|uniref:ABC transporter substrate-binding protein n=1 Tax=Halorubrum sp. AD140 TaxID=3050073 RepID=UPI002ACCF616|nr:ABC transporter substrate-binding protein [Halorubrum sp. AD140]MDZ5811342.1 ABC transporter substrate-binding protein [Halorubrum sp. AD140]